MAKTQAIELNPNTGIGKTYAALKDGKNHSLKTVLNMLKKAGKADPWGAIFAVRRLLAEHTHQVMVVDRQNDKIQIVNKPKTVAKKATKKAVAA